MTHLEFLFFLSSFYFRANNNIDQQDYSSWLQMFIKGCINTKEKFHKHREGPIPAGRLFFFFKVMPQMVVSNTVDTTCLEKHV